MQKTIAVRKILFGVGLLLPLITLGQLKVIPDGTDEETYYVGINPVAPFTGIRGEVTSLYLPYVSNLETGISVSVGKIWNNNYNVETRLSFGSPRASYNLFTVQSGFNYCFDTKQKQWRPYMGAFLKLYSLQNTGTETDYVSAIGYVCAGNRFVWKKFFLDLRLNENIYALSWTNQPGTKAKHGFHESIYKWKSAYIPFASVNIGFMFK